MMHGLEVMATNSEQILDLPVNSLKPLSLSN